MNPRLLAYRALRELENRHTDEVVDDYLKKYILLDADRRFFSQLVIGVVENRIYLDYIIDFLAKGKIGDEVREILRIGLYQLLRLNVPEYAAVNETIVLAEIVGETGAKGLINAILRSYLRRKKIVPLPAENDRRMSVYYSYPLWLVRYWTEMFGAEQTEVLLEAGNSKPPLTLRVNTAQCSVDEYLERLGNKGVEARRTQESAEGIVVLATNGVRIREFPGYDCGDFIVQDESSQLAVSAHPPKSTDICIDVCCSPGGKTTHLAQYAAEVHGFDISKQRLGLAMHNVMRLNVSKRVKLGIADATKGVREWNEMADYVLVDAPCTALGTIRRNPDIKYNRIKSDIAKNAKTQRIILKRAAQYLKKGGILVYSTCTITREENQDVVGKFLEKHPDFVKLQERQLFPRTLGTDGFYYAVMERK